MPGPGSVSKTMLLRACLLNHTMEGLGKMDVFFFLSFFSPSLQLTIFLASEITGGGLCVWQVNGHAGVEGGLDAFLFPALAGPPWDPRPPEDNRRLLA